MVLIMFFFCLSLLIDVQDMHFARLICVFSFFHYNISPVLDYSPVRRPISLDISVTRQKHQQPSKIIISLHNIIAIPCALAICEIKQTRQQPPTHSLANHSRTITCPLLCTIYERSTATKLLFHWHNTHNMQYSR